MYEVESVYFGEAALEPIAEDGADVVRLNRRMSGLSDDVVARHLNQTEYDVHVVMITTISLSFDAATLRIDDCVTKPAVEEQLRDLVETEDLVSEYDKRVAELLALLSRQHVLVYPQRRSRGSEIVIFSETQLCYRCLTFSPVCNVTSQNNKTTDKSGVKCNLLSRELNCI